MKKITITLLLFTFVLRVAGQQMNTLSAPKAPYLSKQSVSTKGLNLNASSRSSSFYDSTGWFNYGDAIYSIYGGSEQFSGFLWPDTLVKVNYDSSGIVVAIAEPYIHEIANIFDAYSPTLQTGYAFQNPLIADSSYVLDSLGLGISYSRNDTSTSVDTLIVYYFQAAPNSSDIPTYYYNGAADLTDYGSDTVFVPFLAYNYKKNELADKTAPITTLKVPLTAADEDSLSTNFHVKTFALATPMTVKAGNLVATAFTFKAGYTYTPGENVDSFDNVLSFISWDEVPGGFPYYTSGDNFNVSSIIENSVRYNGDTVGYNGLFIPSFAYSSGYAYDDHKVYYHIDFNTASIQNVASVVTNQTIYPNPSSDQAMLKYTLKTGASVIINVSDITGKLLLSMNEGNLAGGLNQQLINTHNLADGVYIVSIIANGSTSVNKLVVAR